MVVIPPPYFNPPLHFPVAPVGPQDLAQRLTPIIDALRRMAAAEASRRWHLIPLIGVLHAYLGRVARRFEFLIARLGGPIRARPSRPNASRPDKTPPAPAEPEAPRKLPSRKPPPREPRLPGRFGWLIDTVPYHAAGVATQLAALLRDPEMHALMEAEPQAAKILRKLCRMLRIEPAADLPASLFPIRPKAPDDPPDDPPHRRPVLAHNGESSAPSPLRADTGRGERPDRLEAESFAPPWWFPRTA